MDASPEGLRRARSATEAFFYRRLETLPETAGRFRLNAELPIPFDGWGKMEVDLLCSNLRLVVELDGGQHLSSTDATAVNMLCCRSKDIWCCGSSRKTWESDSTSCWMRFSEGYHIVTCLPHAKSPDRESIRCRIIDLRTLVERRTKAIAKRPCGCSLLGDRSIKLKINKLTVMFDNIHEPFKKRLSSASFGSVESLLNTGTM